PPEEASLVTLMPALESAWTVCGASSPWITAITSFTAAAPPFASPLDGFLPGRRSRRGAGTVRAPFRRVDRKSSPPPRGIRGTRRRGGPATSRSGHAGRFLPGREEQEGWSGRVSG